MGQFSGQITSIQNPRVKALLRLHQRRGRGREGLFAVEGLREIERALEGGIEPADAFYCPDVDPAGEAAGALERLAASGAEVVEVSPRVYEKIAYRGSSGGLMATARRPDTSLERLSLPDDPLIVVVDGVEKPGNYGAVFRSADGAGADAVIVTSAGTDLFGPNVIRASLGTVFTVPAAEADAAEALGWLRGRSVRVVVALPGATVPYTKTDLRGGVAVVVGSEDTGVGAGWIEAADERVGIPMLGRADSLNVSVSAAIILYEALRQRSCGEGGS
jgi:TrmH family RNA methyltransferase